MCALAGQLCISVPFLNSFWNFDFSVVSNCGASFSKGATCFDGSGVSWPSSWCCVSLPVVLVGWSYGGLFVRVYASEHESQVAGLLLVDSANEDQAAKLAAAGFPSDVPVWDRLAPAAAAFGLLRLTGRPSGPRPEAFPEPVRRFV